MTLLTAIVILSFSSISLNCHRDAVSSGIFDLCLRESYNDSLKQRSILSNALNSAVVDSKC